MPPLIAAINLGRRGGGGAVARGLGEGGRAIAEDLGNKLDESLKSSFQLALKPLLDIMTALAGTVFIIAFKIFKKLIGAVEAIGEFFKPIAAFIKEKILGIEPEPEVDFFPDMETIEEALKKTNEEAIEARAALDEVNEGLADFGALSVEQVQILQKAGLSNFAILAVQGALKFVDLKTGSLKTLGEMKDEGLTLFGKFKDKVIQVFQDILDLKKEAREAVDSIGGFTFGGGKPRPGGYGFTGGFGESVQDVIITKQGRVIKTDPNDTIIATQSPGAIGGGKTFNFYGMVPEEVIEFVKNELGKEYFIQGRF